MASSKQALADRLLAQSEVTPSGCREWSGATTRNGYGKITVEGRTKLPHREAYATFKGIIPDGFVVTHTCDNRICINPAHLVLGTHADNSADMVARGRSAAGARNSRAKLSPTQIAEIRQSPKRVFEITAEYGITRAHVWRIRKGVQWQHV